MTWASQEEAVAEEEDEADLTEAVGEEVVEEGDMDNPNGEDPAKVLVEMIMEAEDNLQIT